MDKVELQKVVESVRKTDENDFDMGTWKCGSAFCAIGSYCRDNPESALKLVLSEFSVRPRPCLPEYAGQPTNFEAVAIHFGISEGQAEFLFDPDYYEWGNRDEVAKRIEAAIEAGTCPSGDEDDDGDFGDDA